MKILLSRAGEYWRMVVTDHMGTVERLLVPGRVIQYLRHLLHRRDDGN